MAEYRAQAHAKSLNEETAHVLIVPLIIVSNKPNQKRLRYSS
jgi:hypothetical protein